MAIGPSSKVIVSLDIETKELLQTIAKNTAPVSAERIELDAKCSTAAQLLGTVQGFYVALDDAISNADGMKKAQQLRELCNRAKEMMHSYQNELTILQKQRSEKFGDE